MKTSFKILPATVCLAASVASAVLTTPSAQANCTPPPAGIVGWWSGDGSATDSIGGNNGVLVNGSYTNGVDGSAFSFVPANWSFGTYTGVQIPDQPAYALTNALTIEGWVRPRGDCYSIFWRGDNRPGLDPYGLGMQGNNALRFYVTDAGGNSAYIETTVAYNSWVHLAATLDGSTGTMSIYTNGLLAAQTNTTVRPFADLIAGDSPGVGIGNVNDGGNNFPFWGDIDEIALYNRALSPAEISAIYNAGSAGKCASTPVSCAPPATGIVSWWPGENAATDLEGADSGTWTGTGTVDSYGVGMVGSAFQFDGTHRDRVDVGNPANLQLQDFTIEAWIKRTSATVASLDENFADGSIAGPGGYIFGYGAGGYALVVQDDGTLALSQNSVNDTHVPPVIADTNWHHVAVTKTGGTVTFFVDGLAQPVPSLNPYTNVFQFTTSAAIGSRGDGGGNTFYGLVDEPAIYNRALSSKEVAAIYAAGSAGKCARACVSYTNFATTSGLTLIGVAATTNGVLRLTPAVDSQTGDVWLIGKAGCGGGFDASFHFQISQLGNIYGNEPGGDGFTFSVQNVSQTNASWAMGDSNNCVSVFFNTFWNWPGCTCPDLSDNSVGILINQNYVGQTDLNPTGINMSDGNVHSAHVVFDGATFTVWVDNLMVLTNVPVPALYPGVDSSGQGWVGFTAGTGGAYENHDILDWSFCSTPGSTNYQAGVPAIYNFSPAVATNGAVIAIIGTNFNPNTVSNIVRFGAVQANVLAATANGLIAVVPAGATFGPLTVTVGGLTAASCQMFEPTFPGNGSNITTSSFAPSFNLAAGGNVQSCILADLDGDGKPDIACVSSDNHSVAIFQNISTNGAPLSAASFAPRVDLPVPTNGTGGNPYRVRAVDLDGDGKLDLIACETGGNRVSIFHNISTPGSITVSSFEPAFALISGGDCRFATAGDLDGDGRLDIVALNYGDKTISLFKNTGMTGGLNASSFAPPVTIAAPGGPYDAVIADLDRDGKPDLAVANSDSGTVTVFPNAGTGAISTNSFLPGFDLTAGSGTETITAVDLDGDGKLDIVAGSVFNQTLNIFRNVSAGSMLGTNSFASRVDFGTPGWMHVISIADFDGDGRPDVVAVGELPSYMAIFQNVSTPGDFTSASFAPRVDFSTGWNAWGVVAGDLDGDGRPDVVFCNQYDGTVQIYQSQAQFGTPPTDCTPAPAGIVGWWKGEGNANDSAGANNGTLSPSGASFASAEVGEGFRFDGTNGYVQIPDSDALKPTNVTVEAWVWLDPVRTNKSVESIIFKRNTWTYLFEGYSLTKAPVDNSDGTFTDHFQFVISRNGTQVILYSTTVAHRGVWYHVAGTYDGSQTKLYVNGVAEASAVAGFPLDYGTRPVFIGATGEPAPYDSFFAGIIDEASICNRALASNEIAAIYSAGSSGKCPPPPANLLVNGGFENPPGIDPYQVFDSGNPMPGWVVESGTVEITAGTHWQAAEGAQSLDLNGIFDQIGTIYQSFPTIPGQDYRIRFAYAGNPECGEPTLKTANVYWNDQLVTNLSFDITGHSVTNMGWIYYEHVMTATSTDSRIRFQSTSATFCGLTLDDVSVTPTTLPAPPSILGQPTNITVTVNGTTMFNVIATGTAPLNYQWYFNGTNIAGGASATLVLSNVQPWQAGNYYVTIANSAGSVTSSNVVLTVFVPQVPPTIVAQTPSEVVLLGNPATFGVTVTGTPPLSYFWSRDGALIPGATNSSYTLSNAQLSDSGSQFNCLVTNLFGSAASTNVTLKVLDTISNDLCSGAVVITGSPYTNIQSTLRATAFGDPVPGCVDGFGHGVWYQFTAPVNGQLVVDTFGSDFDTGLAVYTGACEALTEVACNDDTGGVTSQVILPTTAGATYFILAGGYASDAGNLVLHLQHLTAPEFVIQPVDESVVTGSNANFSATLVGAMPMTFQWYFNGNPLMDDGWRIVGSTNASLIISNVTTADAGSYSLTVTNFLGATNSSTATLTVLVPPSITQNPVGRSVPAGLPTIFSVAASGIPSPAYRWQLNGADIPNAIFASYTNSAVGSNDLGWYQVIASNSLGSVTSSVAQLTFGPVAAWGRNLSLECLPPPGLSNVIGVAGGIATGFAVRSDGRVVPWGGSSATNVPASATNVVAISATGPGNYALRSDGTVVSWAGPIPPALSNVVSVAAGFNFGMALRAEGSVVGWGNLPFSTVPAGLNHVIAVSCGFTHTLALRSDGSVTAWGIGMATNVPAGLTNVIAIAAGYAHSLALKANGTVAAWGSGSGTNLPAGLTNIVAISAENAVANSLSLALRADGTVVAWGDNLNGETNLPSGLNSLLSVAITAAPNHGLALVNDGSPQILRPPVGLTVYTGRDAALRATVVGVAPLSYQWLLNGTNVPNATNAMLAIANVQFANAGNYQLFVSNSVGTAISLAAPVKVIGNNQLVFLSQCSVSSSNAYQGGTVTFYGGAVLGSGPLRYQWYYSPTNYPQGYVANYGPVFGATNDTLVLDPALAMQSGSYLLAVSNQFTGLSSTAVGVKIYFARAWGYYAVSNPPVNVTNAIAVATGGNSGGSLSHYLALGADGKVTAWSIPGIFVYFGETNVSALSNSFVTAIAAGVQHSLALKSDGTVYAWGNGAYGQTNPPSGLNSVVAIACGGYHDLALKADGTVVGWGAGDGILGKPYNYGQATNYPAASNVVAIAAGDVHSLALRADGTVVGWGYVGQSATTIPAAATNVVAIAAANGSGAALRANGTVVQWGSGMGNYPTPPANLSNIVAISGSATHYTALRNDGSVVSWGYEYNASASNNVPAGVANVAAISSGGDHDFALLGTRAPSFTVQPWNRTVSTSATSVWFVGKCVGVQPIRYQWRLNGTNLPAATNDTLTVNAMRGMMPLESGVYQLVASNAYGMTASKPAKLSVVVPLGVALNATNLNWTTRGNVPWFGQTNYTHDHVAAARSGGIGGLQESVLQTTLATNVAGNLSFWWKVSSEAYFDTLEFRINGTVQAVISGEADWQQVTIPVPAGTNVLTWRYSKDPTTDMGLDAAFVDQVAFALPPPVITWQSPSQTANAGSTVTFSATATAAGPVTFIWYQTNALYPYVQNYFRVATYPPGMGPNYSDSFVLNNVCRTNDGIYSLKVQNANGTTYGTNVTLQVRAPQVLGAPVLMPDGSLQLISSDIGGGNTLSPSDLANFEAQASTNLMDWVTLPNALSLTNGVLQLQDGQRTNYLTRYYRIVEH